MNAQDRAHSVLIGWDDRAESGLRQPTEEVLHAGWACKGFNQFATEQLGFSVALEMVLTET